MRGLGDNGRSAGLRPARLCLLVMLLLAAVTPGVTAAAADLQARIDAAAPGDTITVAAGVYGPIAVTKPLRLVAERGAVIDGGGEGDLVILAADDCELRGFTLRGSGDSLEKENTGVRVLGDRAKLIDNRFEDVLFGIDLKNADDCEIRGNRISSKPLDIARRGDAVRLFRSNRCLIEGNVIENGRDALMWYSNHVTIRGNVSRNNRYGFHMMFANDVTLEDNELTGNSVGVYLMYGRNFAMTGNRFVRNRGPSGYGLGLKEIDNYRVEANVFAGNRVGVYVDGSPYTRRAGRAIFTRNALVNNDIGMSLLPAVTGNELYANDFVDNFEQVAIQGRGALKGNAFNKDGRGNYWSDFGGYDADRDGVGDQPYAPRQLFESLTAREPRLRLMLFSPAHEAIEFIGRAMPAVQPASKFEDAHPLMSPVRGANVGSAPSRRGGLALLAAGLLAVAAAVGLSTCSWPRLARRAVLPGMSRLRGVA